MLNLLQMFGSTNTYKLLISKKDMRQLRLDVSVALVGAELQAGGVLPLDDEALSVSDGGDWAGDSCVVPVHQRLAVGEAHEARREPRGQREAWAGCRVALAEAGA